MDTRKRKTGFGVFLANVAIFIGLWILFLMSIFQVIHGIAGLGW